MTPTEVNKKLAQLLALADTNVDKLLSRSEAALMRNYKLALTEIKSQIALIYETYGEQVKYSDMVKYNRLTNIENQIAQIIKSLSNESIKTTTSAIKEIYSQSFYSTGYSLESSIGVGFAFGKINPNVVTASVLNPLDRIKWPDRMKEHMQKYMSNIRQEITQGLIQGKSYPKIAKAITQRTEITAGNSLRIVRTEAHRVQSAARLVGFEKAGKIGIETRRIWVATKDSRTRDTHRSMDGDEANKEGLFKSPSGHTTTAPGMFGIPEEDINCRCRLKLELKNLPKKERTIPPLSYEEWFKERIDKK